MSLRIKTSMWVLCAALLGCASHSHPLQHDAGADDEDEDAGSQDMAADAADSSLGVGDPVDLNGDGLLDGEAVDTNGDGTPDGVDTNGDGIPDAPLPGADAGMFRADAGVLIQSDAGALPFPINDAGQILCGSAPCACSNGKDDDNDGISDLADPECVSSWDNDEGSFATGISGDNRDDACQDCFFDGNSGSGNDGCYLPTSCLSEGNASSGHGRCNSCEQTAQCKSFCKAYTPNGCDCFGCCTVRLANGTDVNVALGNGCNIDGNTVQGCNSCVPNDSCRNECGKCELCPGKTLADLPAECFQSPPTNDAGSGDAGGVGDGGSPSDAGTGDTDGGTSTPPSYTCDDGATRCGAGLPACASGYGCEFGCCVLIPIMLL